MNLSGGPLDYLIVFFGGVLLSFTPCVYPLIPISAAYIGVTAATSKVKGLTLSLSYMAGMALTYSFLGLLACLTGRIFGSLSALPATRLVAGIIILGFGISMLDLINIPLLTFIKLPHLKKGSHISTFVVGVVSGLMIGPCTTPMLGSILVYLTSKKSLFYGTTLLFTFACGMGLLLVVVGMFSSLALRLPKSGHWLVIIKRIGACVVMGMGVVLIINSVRRF